MVALRHGLHGQRGRRGGAGGAVVRAAQWRCGAGGGAARAAERAAQVANVSAPLRRSPYGMAAEDIVELELMRNRFLRLMGDVKRGALGRNTFAPWEVELLLDLECCQLAPKRRRQLLEQYERAVQRQMDTGPGPPMKLSEYLQSRSTRRPSSR